MEILTRPTPPSQTETPSPAPGKGMGIASLCLGIISIPTSISPIGGLLGILAIIFGVIALQRKDAKGRAISGIVTGSFGLLVSCWILFALPSLQASQRDTARRNDVSQVVTRIVSYSTENKGELPPDDIITDGSFVADTEIASLSVAGEATAQDAIFTKGMTCDGAVAEASHFTIQIKLESGETYCSGV